MRCKSYQQQSQAVSKKPLVQQTLFKYFKRKSEPKPTMEKRLVQKFELEISQNWSTTRTSLNSVPYWFQSILEESADIFPSTSKSLKLNPFSLNRKKSTNMPKRSIPNILKKSSRSTTQIHNEKDDCLKESNFWSNLHANNADHQNILYITPKKDTTKFPEHSSWTHFLRTDETIEDLSPTPKKLKGGNYNEPTNSYEMNVKCLQFYKSHLPTSEISPKTPRCTPKGRSCALNETLEQKSSMLLDALKSSTEMLDSINEDLDLFSPKTKEMVKTQRLDAIINGMSERSLTDVFKMANDVINDLENDLNLLNIGNSIRKFPNTSARQRLLEKFNESVEYSDFDAEESEWRRKRTPNEIRVASLYFPVLQRDAAIKDMRTELDKAGITNGNFLEFTFSDCLQQFGREIVDEYLDKCNYRYQMRNSDGNVRVCIYCLFRTHSELIMRHHLSDKHRKRFGEWPYTRRMMVCFKSHDRL